MLSVVMVRTVVIPAKRKSKEIKYHYFHEKKIKQKIPRDSVQCGNKVYNNSNQTIFDGRFESGGSVKLAQALE